MIYDLKRNVASYRGISKNLDCALDALLNRDFSALAPGRYELDGDRVSFLVQEPQLRPEAAAQYEIHKNYADIQLTLSGGEEIIYRPTETISDWQPFDEARDIGFSALEEKGGAALPLYAECFAVFFPQDAHMPCLKTDAFPNETTRKVVFKVAMQ